LIIVTANDGHQVKYEIRAGRRYPPFPQQGRRTGEYSRFFSEKEKDQSPETTAAPCAEAALTGDRSDWDGTWDECFEGGEEFDSFETFQLPLGYP
jgi:hypothetical protein